MANGVLNTGKPAANQSGANQVLGYQGRDVGSEYLIWIHDKRPWLSGEKTRLGIKTRRQHSTPIIIRALLQDKIDLTTEARWSPLLASSVVTAVAEEVATVAAGRTLVSRWMTRQMWRGTSPLEFTLNLRFEAESNAETEVLCPCRELQRMSLPYIGDQKFGEQFLSPPGPLPASWAGTRFLSGTTKGEDITIRVGKLLNIKRCIIKRVTVSILPKFVVGGAPLSANVTVNFQTYEIITKESLDSNVYYANRPKIDIPSPAPRGIIGDTKDAYEKAKGLLKKLVT